MMHSREMRSWVGAVGSVIIAGVRRALFSNEAGLGTSDMAHGAAMTKEPVREGLVAMIEPFIDTIVVCTITAIVNFGFWCLGAGGFKWCHIDYDSIC